jgi:hypothetical protein
MAVMDPTFAVCYYFVAACKLQRLLLFQVILLLKNKLKALNIAPFLGHPVELRHIKVEQTEG